MSRDDVAQVEGEDLVGAQDNDDVGVLALDLPADAVEVVRVTRCETTGAHGVDLVGHDAPEAADVAVEIPRPPVLEVLVE